MLFDSFTKRSCKVSSIRIPINLNPVQIIDEISSSVNNGTLISASLFPRLGSSSISSREEVTAPRQIILVRGYLSELSTNIFNVSAIFFSLQALVCENLR